MTGLTKFSASLKISASQTLESIKNKVGLRILDN